MIEGFDCSQSWLQRRDDRHHSQTLLSERSDSGQAASKDIAGDIRVSRRLANCRQHAATGARIWLEWLAAGSLELALAQGNGHQVQRRSTGTDHETEGFLVSAPEHTMRGKRNEVAFQKAATKLRRIKKTDRR
jgi:hypothetical protein